jgi:Secretion system C-terminal sorting domain
MKKILISVLLASALSGYSQATDPSVGGLDIADVSNNSLNANNLTTGGIVYLKAPIYNTNDLNAMPSGTAVVNINIGAKLSLASGFSLLTAPMSEYFSWSISGSIITGNLIAPLPANYYEGLAKFKLQVSASAGTAKIESKIAIKTPGARVANVAGVIDEDPSNNVATLTYTATSSPLPVELLKFSGKKDGPNKNTLSWVTAKEKDFAQFVVEKGKNAKNFEGIATIKSNVNQTSYLQNYSFVDENAVEAINYYRLKMVDNDGTFKYSNIISLENELNKSIVGEFYPNPSFGADKVSVDILSKENSSWQIEQIDITGRIINSEIVYLTRGVNKYSFQTNKLQSGLNAVRFYNNGETETRKIVKQ